MEKKYFLVIVCALLGLGATSLRAQERGSWSMTVGADAVSHYVWRGTESGGPSIQPSVYFDYEKGDWAVSLGAWGTASMFKNRYGEYYDEFDFSAEASWRGLTLSLANYNEYYDRAFDGSYIEFGLSYTISEEVPVTFAWYSYVNQFNGALMDGGSGIDWEAAFPSYFEVAYDLPIPVVDVSVAAGCCPFASDYYENDGFCLYNLNLSAGHEFEFKHGGSLPVAAQVAYNPEWKEFFWGVSVGYYFSLDF